ncbi:CopD family protein [Elizabethkingia argentiflava]|uniref:Protoporphyrinogen IX oxidase n=1 Tax=Elizabethkingia argenteiflava TaxID=2681556 RepID=A0A845PSU4_9FLAO|nr:CopD family protein [Elizabethkingia argenteiflava]NAW50874.1 CopD family protein [Elizabethkingia argenteiflava]
MNYLILKALHIIFMVSYFAGIFYTVRILVYYKDTDDFENPKKDILRQQYAFMAHRLWNIITVPAGTLMLIFGMGLIFINPELLKMPWFHIKITALIALAIYHYWCWKKVIQLQKLNQQSLPSKNTALRQANEIATFILFFVVFTVVLKYALLEYWKQLTLSFVGLVVLISLVVKFVNRRKK